MEKTIPASSINIPTIDLSSFMEGGDNSCQRKVIDTIFEACTNLGVFFIENNGVADARCKKLLELTKKFFSYSDHKKTASTKDDLRVSGAGYGKRSDKFHEFEYVLIYSPEKPFNGIPTIEPIQPDYRKTYEDVFRYFVKISQILEKIINDCLKLPQNFLTEYNTDRSWDFMLPLHYAPSNEHGDVGVCEHADPSMITIILQEDVCGLEVFKDDEWFPITPDKGKLVVVVPDLIQVYSNKKVTNTKHRALKNAKDHRLAIDFCYNFGPYKWVEPLHKVTTEIGEKPKYRGFTYHEYIDMINTDIITPPEEVEDYVKITYYEI